MKTTIVGKVLFVATSCALLSSIVRAQNVEQIKPDQMKPIESGPAKSGQVESDANTWDWVAKESLPKGTMYNKDYVPDINSIFGSDDGSASPLPPYSPWGQVPPCIVPPCPDDPTGTGERPNT